MWANLAKDQRGAVAVAVAGSLGFQPGIHRPLIPTPNRPTARCNTLCSSSVPRVRAKTMPMSQGLMVKDCFWQRRRLLKPAQFMSVEV
jgi:hypothetical protein